MEFGKRVHNFIQGIALLMMCVLMFFLPSDYGVEFIISIIAIWLVVYGIRLLHFYSSMARHMVGGKIILILGFILFDFGIFSISISQKHTLYIILYLLGFYAFKAFVDIMRSFEQRKNNASGWELKMITGFINAGFAIFAVITGIFLRSEGALVFIFAFGIAYSAIMRFVSAFRKTPAVLIL